MAFNRLLLTAVAFEVKHGGVNIAEAPQRYLQGWRQFKTLIKRAKKVKFFIDITKRFLVVDLPC